MSDSHGAIVMGLSPTGLYATRELAEAGVPVLGVSRHWDCGCVSRSLTHSERAWHVRTDEELLDRLLGLASRDTRRYILIPTDDQSIEFITTHCAVLEESFLFQESYSSPLTSSIIDKFAFYDLCERAGIPYPQIYCGRPRQLLERIDRISFPSIIKPTLIHKVAGFMAGRKVLVARTPEEMSSILRSVPDVQQDWLVQEVIPGPESQLVMVAGYRSKTGCMCQMVTARKLRQYPPGFGNASLVRTETLDTVTELTEKILHKCEFQGIFAAEFKYDERDCQYKLIEINPRPSLWFNVARYAGKRIVYAAFCDLSQNPLPVDNAQINDVYWRYTLKDTYSMIWYTLAGKNFVLPRPDIPSRTKQSIKCWAVYESKDWMPAIAEVGKYINKMWLKHLRRSGSH